MKKVSLRDQVLDDAERFYEILNDPNLVDTGPKPESVEAEREWLKKSFKDREKGHQYNYTIMYGDEIAGCLGVKINIHRKYVGEFGCFIDSKLWGKGIATEALKLAEKQCFEVLNLLRVETIVPVNNIASQKAAIKAGYKKEGVLRQAVRVSSGEMKDVVLFAKVLHDVLSAEKEE